MTSAAVDTTHSRTRKVLLAIIMAVIVGAALAATYVVSMPLALAVFSAMMLRPVERWVAGRAPRRLQWLGLVLCVTIMLLVMAAAVGAVWLCVDIVAPHAPKYGNQLRGYWESFVHWSGEHQLPVDQDTLKSDEVRNRLIKLLTGGLLSLWSVVGVAALLLFLTTLMLGEAEAWRKKVKLAAPGERGEQILSSIDTIAVKLRHHMWIRTWVSVVSGAIEGGFFWLCGVDFAVVWGFLAFLFNYVPNIGSTIALCFPIALAFMQYGVKWGLFVGIGVTAIDQALGNLMEPRIQGNALSVSPTMILAAILLWGWAWGVVGAVLATPILIATIVACAHTQSLRWLAVLLSEKGDEEAFTCEQTGTCTPGNA